MPNNIKDVLNDKAFDVLSNEKKQIFNNLIERLQKLSFDEAINELIKFYENMPKASITENERNEMIDVILSKMPKNEQQKIRLILSSLYT